MEGRSKECELYSKNIIFLDINNFTDIVSGVIKQDFQQLLVRKLRYWSKKETNSNSNDMSRWVYLTPDAVSYRIQD
jgi:hypothetical protein